MARRPKSTPEEGTHSKPSSPDAAVPPHIEDKDALSLPPSSGEGAAPSDVNLGESAQSNQNATSAAQVGDVPIHPPLPMPQLVDTQTTRSGEPDHQSAPALNRPSYLIICLLALMTGAIAGSAVAFLSPRVVPGLNQVTPQSSLPAGNAFSDKITALDAAVQAQAKREASLREEITTLATRMAETRQSSASQNPEPEVENARLSALEAQFAALTQKNTALTALSLAGAQLVATERLVNMLDKSTPLAPMLETLGALGLPADKLAVFTPFAQTGATGFTALQADFAATRANILEARAAQEKEAARASAQADAEQARNIPPPANWREALTARFSTLYEQAKQKTANLINIRSKGEKPALSSPSDTAVEAALMRGDLAAAITAIDAKPDAERVGYAALRSRLEARLKASIAARVLMAEAEAALKSASLAVSQ